MKNKNKLSTNLDDSEAIFLTSSFYLYKTYLKLHSKFESFPAIILDSQMTNILYLRSPNKNMNISVEQVIKIHSKYLIIDHNIWLLFISFAKELFNEKKIDEHDYSRLVNDNQITRQALLSKSPDDLKKEQLLGMVDKLKEIDSKKQEKIHSYEREIEQKDSAIDELTKRIYLLENEKNEKNKENKFKEAYSKYTSDLNIHLEKEWINENRKIKRTNILYFLFISIAIFLFTRSFFSNDSFDINCFIFHISGRTINYLSAFIVFLLPFIRSFFNHEKILIYIKTICKKEQIKYKQQFYEKEKQQYILKNPEPKLD